MKKSHLATHRPLNPLCAIAVLGLSTAVLTAQDSNAPKIIKSSDGETKTVVVPGPAPAEATTPTEVIALKKAIQPGVRISGDTFAKLQAVPVTLMQSLENVDEKMVYRYLGGNVYIIEPTTYKVEDVIDLPDSKKAVEIKTMEETEGLDDAELKRFRESLVVGYQIPRDRFIDLKIVPASVVDTLPVLPEGKAYRYLSGMVYTLDTKTYTIVDTTAVSTDGTQTTNRKLVSEKEATEFQKLLVKGYQVPKDKVAYFQEIPTTVVDVLPAPVQETEYRYLNGIVYTVDPITNRILESKSVAEITAGD